MKGVRSLVAAPYARVREAGARHRNESPRVAGIAERQLENAEDAGVAHLTVRLDRADRRRPDPARAHRELPDPPLQIEHARWGLGREAFVQLVMRVEHELGTGGVEIIPERL